MHCGYNQLDKWVNHAIIAIFLIGLISSCDKDKEKGIPSYEIQDFKEVLQLKTLTDTFILKQVIKGHQGKDEGLKSIIQKEYNNIQSLLPNRTNEISSRQIDYAKIIATYDRGDLRKAKFLLENTFQANINEEELEGYLVACYYGLGLFKKAATIKFKSKNESKQELHDYAKCLRNIGLTQSYDTAELFNNSLDQKENSNDNIWIYIPIEVSSHLFRNIHSINAIEKTLSDKDKLKLYQFLTNQGNNPRASIALYLLGHYEVALKYGKDNLFYDIYLYARGYDIIQKYSINYIRFKKQGDLTEEEKLEVKKALLSFLTYIELYPNRVHADDAAYWIAFCHALLENHLDIFIGSIK